MALLRRFLDTASGTCSYLIGSPATRQAVFIDPVRAHLPLYLGVLAELRLSLAGILETHVHADHVTAAGALRDITGAAIACSRLAGVEGAEHGLEDGQTIAFGDLRFRALATPGHSPACLTYCWGDRLFTGDALLIGGCGRLDEPGGNPGQLFDSLTRRLLPLPDEYLVFPGHGSQQRWVSCIGEEKRNNPMLLGLSRDEFIAINRRRREPPLPSITRTLAANRHCGELPDQEAGADLFSSRQRS